VTWSLSVEMFFYLVFPFAIVALRRLRGRGLAVTAAVTLGLMAALPLIVAQAGVDTHSNLYYWLFFVFPPYRFGEFLLGLLLARAMVLGLRIPAPAGTALVAAAGVGGLTWVMTSFTVRTGIAFALYLVHSPAMMFTARFGWWDNPGGPLGLAYLLAFLVLAASAALHHLVEKPVERRLRRIPIGAATPAARL
jgi:peptidoglycan/LPS O-acetylase OafA/YrhL